jgi:hypothetical protein
MSDCNGKGKHLGKRLSELKQVSDGSISSVAVSGFVFHESRVGSTLVANLLASDKYSMVFSESAPPASVLLCKQAGCLPRSKQVELFRDVVSLMCRSTHHKRCFFKFQSITTTMIGVALEAFPSVPWIFLYRDPVETMMSHVGPGKGRGAPCLRSKRRPSIEVLQLN